MTQLSFAENVEHDPGGKVKLPMPASWKPTAIWYGPNREYRTLLSYQWGEGRHLLAAMMNPSVANEYCLDPTLAKIGRLAEKWGYSGFSVVNACDYRCTDSRLLSKTPYPCSGANSHICASAAHHSDMVIVGYGKLHKSLQCYAEAMVRALRTSGKPLYALAVNKDGSPQHPLYIREDATPLIWDGMK